MEISVCYIDEKIAMEAALKDDAKLPNAIKKCNAICISLCEDKCLIAFKNDKDMVKAMRYINHVYGKGTCKEYEERCVIKNGFLVRGIPSEA